LTFIVRYDIIIYVNVALCVVPMETTYTLGGISKQKFY